MGERWIRPFKAYKQLPIDCPDRKSRQPQPAARRRAPRPQVEAQAVRRAAQYAPLQLATRKRSPVMGARIVNGVDRAIDVEQDNAAAVDKGQPALTRPEFVCDIDHDLT
jgi:Flp pilus assembly protein CpaB